jgi:hypothetical protein
MEKLNSDTMHIVVTVLGAITFVAGEITGLSMFTRAGRILLLSPLLSLLASTMMRQGEHNEVE